VIVNGTAHAWTPAQDQQVELPVAHIHQVSRVFMWVEMRILLPVARIALVILKHGAERLSVDVVVLEDFTNVSD